MSTTIDFYRSIAETFAEGTLDIDFSDVQNRFLTLIPEGGSILDFGCGSGRDTKCFINRGYEVDAIDGTKELCEIASKNTGINVKQMLFSELDDVEKYDGIWACASVLHLPKDELRTVLNKMIRATKQGGHIYASFKYGDYEGYRKGRFFTDFTPVVFNEYIKGISGVSVVDEWISYDARPGRSDEKWLNVIMRKSDTV